MTAILRSMAIVKETDKAKYYKGSFDHDEEGWETCTSPGCRHMAIWFNGAGYCDRHWHAHIYCTQCGKRARNVGGKMCQRCLDHAKRYRVKYAYLCSCCRRVKPNAGMKTCQPCLDARKALYRRAGKFCTRCFVNVKAPGSKSSCAQCLEGLRVANKERRDACKRQGNMRCVYVQAGGRWLLALSAMLGRGTG